MKSSENSFLDRLERQTAFGMHTTHTRANDSWNIYGINWFSVALRGRTANLEAYSVDFVRVRKPWESFFLFIPSEQTGGRGHQLLINYQTYFIDFIAVCKHRVVVTLRKSFQCFLNSGNPATLKLQSVCGRRTSHETPHLSFSTTWKCFPSSSIVLQLHIFGERPRCYIVGLADYDGFDSKTA